MAKFLGIWRINGTALPADPAKQVQGIEMILGQVATALKEGQIEDFGFFPNGFSGFAIMNGEAADVFGGAISFFPWIEFEVNEMIPFEKGKEITNQVIKYQMDAMRPSRIVREKLKK